MRDSECWRVRVGEVIRPSALWRPDQEKSCVPLHRSVPSGKASFVIQDVMADACGEGRRPPPGLGNNSERLEGWRGEAESVTPPGHRSRAGVGLLSELMSRCL